MYLAKIPRPAYGVRIPEIIVPAILKALKALNMYATLMLSYHRETAPKHIIESTDPRYFYFGHTGTSIDEYISKSRRFAEEYAVPIEIEADHISIMGSVERAIKRIAGAEFEAGLSEDEIRSSLEYIEQELKEASAVGGVDFVTIDTCELVDLSVDKLRDKEVLELYESRIDFETRKQLETKYLDKVFTFASDDRVLVLRFNKVDIARLALKYLKSIECIVKIYEIAKKYLGKEFGVEVALDELPSITNVKEAYFYAREIIDRGVPLDFIAPNIGFKKREDYEEPLDQLYDRVKDLHTVLSNLGVYISVHSGSGAHPYSDKGFGVWETIRRATQGFVKYKMSGVLVQLMLEVMARQPPGSKARKLYEEIFDTVLDHLRKEVEQRRGLASPALERMLHSYEEQVRKGEVKPRDPRVEFFRHYFFVFQTVRDGRGRRWLREAVIELFKEDHELRKAYEYEVYELISRQARALGYVDSAIRFRMKYL